MAVLNNKILVKHGPYIDFADRNEPLSVPEGGWPHEDSYSKDVFFEFSDDLMDMFCTFTKSYSPFDTYEVSQFSRPHGIMRLSSEFLLWAHYVSRSATFYFNKHLHIYKGSARFTEGESPSAEILQQDMLDTMLFLADRLNKMAVSKRCLVIVGI